MVERTATDDGEEESLEAPRRAYEKQAVSDVAPCSGLRPPADAAPHIETDAAPDDNEPQPRRLPASARSKRADHDDADVSSSPTSVDLQATFPHTRPALCPDAGALASGLR